MCLDFRNGCAVTQNNSDPYIRFVTERCYTLNEWSPFEGSSDVYPQIKTFHNRTVVYF